MIHNHNLEEIWHQVPPDYYQKGVKKNLLQRIWHSNKLDNVVSSVRSTNKNPQNILDVGCASGWFLSELIKKFPDAKGVGIDVYKEAIDFGKKKYKNLTLIKADAHKIPLRSNTFDIIVCCEVLEHVENPEKVIAEMRRLLKKDGTLIVEIDTGNWLFRLVWYFWTNLRKGVWRDSHIHLFDTEKIRSLVRKGGFKVKESRLFNFSMAVVFVLKPTK